MRLSIDFGASTIDCVAWRDSKIFKIASFNRDKIRKFQLFTFINDILHINVNFLDQIAVTGGKSLKLPNLFSHVPIRKVNEIDAIGRGGAYLIQNSKFKIQYDNSKFKILVVSMGTGTCMVKVSQNSNIKIQNSKFKIQDLEIEHVGGTGVGGGTFLALCKELLGVTDVEKLVEFFHKGDSRKVDLLVRDIVGKGIGIVPGTSTASNLGKLAREVAFTKSDLAAGIANLIGQTIAITSIFAAKSHGVSMIVYCGKLTRIQKIMDVIFAAGEIYKMGMIVPENAEYVSAIGAGI